MANIAKVRLFRNTDESGMNLNGPFSLEVVKGESFRLDLTTVSLPRSKTGAVSLYDALANL